MPKFWPSLGLSQTDLEAHLRQARADAPGHQIPVETNVLTDELVQAICDSVGFRSVDEDQPPILLLLHLVRSWCHAKHAVFVSGFGHSLRQQTCRSSVNTPQTHLLAQLTQARSDANASGEQVSMKALSRGHEFVHAVDELCGFWSVHKDQPPVLSLLHFILSWALAQAPPSHAQHPDPVHVQAVSPVWMALDAPIGFAPAA